MTANPDLRGDAGPGAGIRHTLKIAAAGLLVLFTLGATVGAFVATADLGITPKRIVLTAGLVLAAIAAGYWLVSLLRRFPSTGPEAPRVATARRMVVISGAVGGLLGVLMAVATIGVGDAPAFAPFSDAPLPPLLAALLIAILVLVVPPVTWIWHRSIDEHETAAYRLAALIALYAYFWLSVVWWLGARGGFLPPVEGIIVFFVTIAVWGLGWAWARFR